MRRVDIVRAISKERERQDTKFSRIYENGRYIWPSEIGTKLAVLMEEVGEIATAILNKDENNLKEELIQVAAVCVAILESEF